MSAKRTAMFDDEELFLLESQNNIKRDEKFDLPLTFLSALYEHGYEVVKLEENKTDVNPFFCYGVASDGILWCTFPPLS